MVIAKRILIGTFGLVTVALIAEIPVALNVTQSSLFSAAHARLGRPATPVSVAGVGRRTVRRCAAGAYNC